jgi:hypothetical protein
MSAHDEEPSTYRPSGGELDVKHRRRVAKALAERIEVGPGVGRG